MTLSVYKVVLAKVLSTVGEIQTVPQITQDKIPIHQVCSWLYDRSINNSNTAVRYAHVMVKYLTFLSSRGIHYREAGRKEINAYIKYLLFGSVDNLVMIDPQCTTSTLFVHTSAISSFYKWLENEYCGSVPPELFDTEKKRPVSKDSFWYGQIWKLNYGKVLYRYIRRTKPLREYIKWYSNEEKDALMSNFLSLRDRAIFAITLEGARIDEVLSLTLNNYDRLERVVMLNKSKTKVRPIYLSQTACDDLDKYIWTERASAESNSGVITQWLFINVKKGKNQGSQLKYRSYWEILKSCAKRAGLNEKLIRTHSGRSTKMMELLEHQVIYPEDNITEEHIRIMMGWTNMSSAKPYINHQNLILTKSAAEKIHRRREETLC